MTKSIESDALDNVYRVLGLSGGALPKGTLLDDGNVSQVLTVNDIVRRSRTPGVTVGFYYGILLNIHAAAGEVATSIDPYSVGAFGQPPYPSPVLPGFDVWCLTASVNRRTGAGTLDGAVLSYDPTGIQRAFGRNSAAAEVSTHSPFPLARWTALDLETTQSIGVAGDGGGMVKIGLRLGRGGSLGFTSDVAAAAANIECNMILGLFPEALGQDIAT